MANPIHHCRSSQQSRKLLFITSPLSSPQITAALQSRHHHTRAQASSHGSIHPSHAASKHRCAFQIFAVLLAAAVT
jgi:hypothetical protein